MVNLLNIPIAQSVKRMSQKSVIPGSSLALELCLTFYKYYR